MDGIRYNSSIDCHGNNLTHRFVTEQFIPSPTRASHEWTYLDQTETFFNMQANITVNGPASSSHANWDYNRKDVTYDGIIWNSRGKSFGSWPSSSRDIQIFLLPR